MSRIVKLASVLVITGVFSVAWAVTPQPEESRFCKAWCDNVFSPQVSASGAFLKIVHEDVPDGMKRWRSWRGSPFQIGDKTYANGLAFNSTKHLRVHLGRPASRFIAEIGLENNDDTRRGDAQGQGSVTFHVYVAGKEVFASKVLRLKDGPTSLDVPLNDAEEFEIQVQDGGDGRGWDQALWGEARVLLRDGSTLSLHELPIEGNPFILSFQYQGKDSKDLLGKWSRKAEERNLAPDKIRREVTFTDPATGLEIRIQADQFKNFPAVEWVAYLTNRGNAKTPVLENIQAMDGILPGLAADETTLHWAKGGVASFDDFMPQSTPLKAGSKTHLQPGGGRSSNAVLPFFNIADNQRGVVAAIGWTGEWAAEFAADSAGQVSFKAGMAKTHLALLPGETIRTPKVMLLFYQGDVQRGQNLLRQFILAHHRPMRDGKPLMVPVTCGNWGGTSADVHMDNIQKFIKYKLPIEYYWIDAEWYGQGSWAVNVGNWATNTKLYPDGFKPLSKVLKEDGRKLMVWFEPERVFKGTQWAKEHPDWMFDVGGDQMLLNLGNPEARKFVTDFISQKIDEFGLGCYRQDFNMDPLGFWQSADAPDRQGISEIRHIEGLYAFWDELLERHPNLIIDNCASGGKRIDLETTGRSTPFWRTDGPRDAIAHQCHTYGLLSWVPFSATSQDREGDTYEFRSSMCSSLCINWNHSGDGPQRPHGDFPWAWAKQTLDQYMQIRDYYYGDYYPLTSYSQSKDHWMAYQLHLPESGKGLVVVLRRPNSPYRSVELPLLALEANASYRVLDLDTQKAATCSGTDLTKRGIEVAITDKPGSALLQYERQP